ncbi:MAG: helix-turn-helix transcriptional regulator [Oscillospiraceae bacterium]|nr:helix-turn-helix transcriptional regulator [Oscillospiraceae bacterium]
MENYIYETHDMEDPLLPFIFHSAFQVVQHHCPPNWHENVELLYCLSGEGRIHCGADHIPFLPGDLYIVNWDLPHCVYSDTAVTYCCLIIDNAFLRENGLIPEQLHFQHSIRDDRFAGLFMHLNDAFARHHSGNALAVLDIRQAVLSLLQLLCREYVTDVPRDINPNANAHIKKALLYIRQNIRSALTLDDIATAVGISKYHLSREFKALTGKTVIEMVNLIRCTEAKHLIECGAKVCTAATACGYENLSYFSRVFQKNFHALPSAFSPKKGCAK